MSTTATRPAFRKPWTHGAAAYTEADTFAAMYEGLKRTRKSRLVHMPNDGEAGDQPCAVCGIRLRDPYPVNPGEAATKVDRYSTWHYIPSRKSARGAHYYCSWGALLSRLV